MITTSPSQPGIFTLEGEVDLQSAPEIREALAPFFVQKVPRLLIDMTKVSYIDSSGLALFIEALQRVQGYGGTFALFGLGESIRTIFHVACLDQVFTLYPDLAAANGEK